MCRFSDPSIDFQIINFVAHGRLILKERVDSLAEDLFQAIF